MASNNGINYVLITGASSGIGYELAKIFAANNHHLILVSRTAEDLDNVARELKQQNNIDVVTIAKDLFEPDAAMELYDEVKNRGLNVNILVNDAGQGQHGFFADTDIDRDLEIIQLNIISLVVLTKMFLRDMLANDDGKILQLASIASKYPAPLLAVYGATKAFVLSFSEAIANELKGTNVSITALMPGATDTDFFNKADAENTNQVKHDKLSDPAEVARDGYDALMNKEIKVVSGAKNKVMSAISNVMPDSANAASMRKLMEEDIDTKSN
ncbi:MAG: SDR family oxidoreductase [Bacteroidota bacterium]